MNHKELGRTGVRLPEIGLGTWEYKGGVSPLRKGIELGASLIDTAEIYGAEDVVGRAMRGDRANVFVATKVWPTHFRYRDLLQAANNSLARLQSDYIDLYQLHWPNAAVRIEETMAAMEQLVDDGKARFIGVCNFSVQELKRAQACLSKQRIVSNQVQYSLAFREPERGILRYCMQQQITVIAYSPLDRGIDKIRRKDPSGSLSKVAQMIGKTEAQVALNWCISKNGVIAIPKADSLEHTVENCHASGWRLLPEHMDLLESNINASARIPSLRRMARQLFPKRYHLEALAAPESLQ